MHHDPALTPQNPDTPQEKPKLQSYQVDLNQCGPMMLDALVSDWSLGPCTTPAPHTLP
jgi:hypothetical protein